MKSTLIFILSAIAIQSYAAIKWNCTSPDLPQSYLPKECTGIASGSASAGSGSSSATHNGDIYGVNLVDCAVSTYNAYTEGKLNGTDERSVCLNSLANNLKLPTGYSENSHNVSCTGLGGNQVCSVMITISSDGTSNNLILLANGYPANDMLKDAAKVSGVSADLNNIILCDTIGNNAVCPAGTYSFSRSSIPPGLKKN